MIYFYLLLIILLNRIPKIGDIFKKVSTMFHELGHAIMTILTSGRVYGIQLFKDNRGTAVTGTRNWFSRVLVTLSGYPTEIAMSLLLLYLYVNNLYDMLIYVLLGATLFTFVFIRNWYGFIWLIMFGILNYIAYQHISEKWVEYYLLGVTLLTVGEAMYSSFTIMVLSAKDRKNAGDATSLAESTKIPAIIWGTVFFCFSVFIFCNMIELLKMIEIL